MPTPKLNAIIVDDEIKAIENLCKLLSTYCPRINVIDTALGVDTAATLINSLKPEVVFLDISMPRKNGFELLNLLRYMPLVVFVTAHEQYAINAIKASAVDFLLKPVDVNELKNVEEKLVEIQQLRTNNTSRNYSATISSLVQLLHKPDTIRKITLPHSLGYNILNTDEIVYLEGENNYTTFYLHKQQKIIVSKTLKEYEDMLTDSGFMRIHKSSIINLSHLKDISKKNGIAVIMDDGRCLPVSRRRLPELVNRAKNYIDDAV